MRVLSPTACLGLMPLNEDSFRRGMTLRPDVVGVDAGSLDPGPHYLGAGTPHVARFQAVRELKLLLGATLEARIPLVIGTAGGSGGLSHIACNLDCIDEALRSLGRKARVAVIPTTLDKTWLKHQASDLTIHGCQHDEILTEADVDACEEIVAQVGVESLMRGFEQEPDVILAGRACDNAVFASLPILEGFNRGDALYMGKILECGGLCLEPSAGYETVVAEIDEEGFTLIPGSAVHRCTVPSVAAHALYERTDPSQQAEPGGILDTSDVVFEGRDDGSMRLTGARFRKSETYQLKLEGAEKVGHRAIFLSGSRDPAMIAHLRAIRERALERIGSDMEREGHVIGRDFFVTVRLYGIDGVLGELESVRDLPHEVGIVLEVIAPTSELARNIAYYGKNFIAWSDFPGRVSTAGNVAYAHSPSILDAGNVYRLRVHHLLPIEDFSHFDPYVVEVG